MDDSAHTKAAYAFIDTRTSSLSLWGHYIGEYTRSLLSSSVLLLPLCLFAPFFIPLCAFLVCLSLSVRQGGGVGGWELGRRPLFICLHKPHLFLQPDVNWHTSLSAALPTWLPFFLPSAPSSPTHPPSGRSGKHPTTSYNPPTLSSASPTPPPPLNPFSIAQDECVFKAEIDCGYQSYGAIHHSRYYSDEQDWTRRWDSWAHGWVLGGRWALNLEGV